MCIVRLLNCHQAADMKVASNQVEWVKFGIIVESLSIHHNFQTFPMVSSSQHHCIVSFINTLTLLESWFTIYPFLPLRIADVTIQYSHKVLKHLMVT